MCLTCSTEHSTIQGKQDLFQLFNPSWQELAEALGVKDEETFAQKMKNIPGAKTGNILRTFNNKEINLTTAQTEEIVNNALAVIATGIDMSVTIWAIQWPNDYVVKTLNLFE